MTLSDLPAFIAAYIACALFSESIGEEIGATLSMPSDTSLERAGYLPTDIAKSGGLANINAACEEFVRHNADDLREIDPERAGHDFWLTRNRHGAGFWDRGLGAIGDRLTQASHVYGEANLRVGDDNRIYHS